MSPDQLLVSSEPALAPPGDARDSVVVPWRQVERRRASRPAGADRPARRVDDVEAAIAQFSDYRGRAALPVRPAGTAPSPVEDTSALPLGLHAEELDTVLCQHIEVQLDLIARYAPELEPSVETVLRSLELLLKLRRD